MSIEHIRWIYGAAMVAIMVVLAVMSHRQYRQLDKLDDSKEKLEPGLDNKEMDEGFAHDLEKGGPK